jgi:hypothetical protein
MNDVPVRLDRTSVIDAVADYLLQANHRGYQPDRRKVLAVRQTDRTAWLRDACTPSRREVWYYIEGELFPEAGATQLAEGETHTSLAERLVARVWDELWVWNAYDFTPTSGGLEEARSVRP